MEYKCPFCNKVLKYSSLNGHVKEANKRKEEASIKFQVCNKILKISSLYWHMKHHEQNKNENEYMKKKLTSFEKYDEGEESQ